MNVSSEPPISLVCINTHSIGCYCHHHHSSFFSPFLLFLQSDHFTVRKPKMASFVLRFVSLLVVLISLFHLSMAARNLEQLVQDQTNSTLPHHNGPLLYGQISVNLIWYSDFKPTQRSIFSYFISFISSLFASFSSKPSVAGWWKTTEKYYRLAANTAGILSEE